MPHLLDTAAAGFDQQFRSLLSAKREDAEDVGAAVDNIIADVRDRGDAALIELTARYDGLDVTPQTLRIPPEEIAAAAATVSADDRAALTLAASRVRAYHARQMPRDESFTDPEGATLGWRWTPVDAAGLYVPGGQASYPSSVLMNAVPARVAGVGRLVVCVPAPGGQLNPLVLAACQIAGVDEVYRIGGAQAIAALAYGTATVPAVDKITGPGNAYVAAAKARVFGRVGIDMIAGPSEVVIIADGTANPEWLALDLLAQAEHDADAQSILLTPDAEFARSVAAEVDRLLPGLPRAAIAGASWRDHGAIVVTRDLAEAAELSNRLAPEHLEICTDDPDAVAARIRHAGAIFLGGWTPEAAGDYVSGPNHVLPTARSARFSSGLSVMDFLKRTTISRLTPAALAAIGPAAVRLAEAEGLGAHARSVAARIAQHAGQGARS
ncbi:histidinol dehydrogenase [Paracoccus suum]|uniref:Histidinol dehydrogenase n=1 Tax=Paracoccus suum TaxID=2259340 RepID=A0A344PMQ6_9RHOB|nr:histidinol dehydrogenase [Paracoccus suum]AXC50661.1 histidinol dehydrogenase [Paracoccus suum]